MNNTSKMLEDVSRIHKVPCSSLATAIFDQSIYYLSHLAHYSKPEFIAIKIRQGLGDLRMCIVDTVYLSALQLFTYRQFTQASQNPILSAEDVLVA